MRNVLTKIGRDPMKHVCTVFLLASLMTSPALAGSVAPDSVAARIARVAQKDSITVLVTDSGLGGLSVCADLDARVRRTGAYRKVRIIFANALPESNRGYNRMKTTEEKVRVFDAALHGMARTFSPDVILVACNTLSVLIPQTGFVATSRIPVLGIVETGVGMLFEQLSADPASTAVIFGTETTIGADTHRRLLIERGIDPGRLVTQACPNLAGAIETDVRSGRVSAAITGFASEAAGKISPGTGRVLAGLCCTHYGYAAGQFQAALGCRGTAERCDRRSQHPDERRPVPCREGPVDGTSGMHGRSDIAGRDLTGRGCFHRRIGTGSIAGDRRSIADPYVEQRTVSVRTGHEGMRVSRGPETGVSGDGWECTAGSGHSST